MLVAIAADGGMKQKKLTFEEFRKLSKAERHAYLREYPNSTHGRLLLNKRGKRGPQEKQQQVEQESPQSAQVEQAPPPSTVQEKPKKRKAGSGKSKPSTKSEGAPVKEKAAEPKHSEALSPSKKVPFARSLTVQPGPPDHDSIIEKQIEEINNDSAGVVNKNSLAVVHKLENKHLAQAAQRMLENKTDIIEGVANQAEKQPVLFDRGMGKIQRMLEGEPDQYSADEEDDTADEKAAKRVLTSISSYALLATGMVLMASGAAPLAAVAGYALYSVWQHNGGHNQRRDTAKKRRKEIEKEERELAEKREAVAKEAKRARDKANRERLKKEAEFQQQQIEHSKTKALPAPERKKRDIEQGEIIEGEFTAVASSSFLSKHGELLDIVIEQIADVFKHHDVDDFAEMQGHIFGDSYTATASAGDSVFDNLFRQLGFSFESPAQNRFVFDSCCLAPISESLERMGFDAYLKDDGWHFHNPETKYLITLGSDDNRCYAIASECS